MLQRVMMRMAAASWDAPRRVLVAAAVCVCTAAASLFFVRFESDMADLAPPAVRESVAELERLFGVSEQLVLLFEVDGSVHDSAAANCLTSFAEHVAKALRQSPTIVRIVFGWHEVERALKRGELLGLAPLYAADADARSRLSELLTSSGVQSTLERQVARIGLPGLGEAEEWFERDPLELREFLLRRLGARQSGLRTRAGSPHFLSEDGAALLFVVHGRARSSDLTAVRMVARQVDLAVDAAQREHLTSCSGDHEVSVARTGSYAYALESEASMRRDLTLNITVSILLVVAVLGAAWRSVRFCFAVWVSLTLGIAVGTGLYFYAQREVVVLALVSGAVLAALGVDAAIHLAEPLRAGRRPTRDEFLAALEVTASSLFFATFTSVVGFLAFASAGGGFLFDMGLMTSIGLTTTLISTLTVLPAILALQSQRPGHSERTDDDCTLGEHEPLTGILTRFVSVSTSITLRRPAASLCLAALVVIVGVVVVVLRPPDLESDLRSMHAANSGAIETQRRLQERFGLDEEPLLIVLHESAAGGRRVESEDSPVGVVTPTVDATTSSEEALLESLHRLEVELSRLVDRGVLAGWRSPLDLIPPPSEQHRVLGVLAAKRPHAASLREGLEEAFDAVGFSAAAVERERARLDRLLKRREPLSVGEAAAAGLAGPLSEVVNVQAERASALVAVYPSGALWSREARRAVVGELESALATASVHGRVTGLYVSSQSSADYVVRRFLTALLVAALAVCGVTLALFRGCYLAFCALVPVVVGMLGVSCIWALAGWKINFMNVGILPMILGIGIDDGIHIVTRYARQGRGEIFTLMRSVGRAVSLTSVTTLGAFGSLALATNRGLASVGVLAGLGIVLSLLASLLVLPPLLELHRRRR